jgi:hypothetical protein
MNSLHCCQLKRPLTPTLSPSDGERELQRTFPNGSVTAENEARKTLGRRVREGAGWFLPGALLALMPKCPICLAAYVALCTGFTMSRSSAHILMRTLTAVCVGTLALLVVKCLVNCFRNKQQLNFQLTQTQP